MTNIQNALLVMAVGISGVFFVLVLFYFIIKALTKLFPEKGSKAEEHGDIPPEVV